MLKRLVILALLATASVCLLEGQTAPLGAPKEGIAKPGSGQNGGNQPQTEDGQKSAPNSVAASPQPAAPACDEACQQGRQNLAIQGKLEWFTGLLVVVGFLQAGTMIWQAWLLRETLRKIGKQAEVMEGQLIEMKGSTALAEQSAKAAEVSAKAALRGMELAGKSFEVFQKSVDAAVITAKASAVSAAAAEQSAKAATAQIEMVKNKERAQLRIEFGSLSVAMTNIGKRITITYKIQVFGTTRATILHSSIAAWVPLANEELNVSGIIDLPAVVFPSEEKMHFQELVRENSFQRAQVAEEVVSMVMDNTRCVVTQGHIRYQDVFGDVWILPFSVSWKNNSFPISSHIGGYWDPYKDPYGEENREYLEKPGHYMVRARKAEMPS